MKIKDKLRSPFHIAIVLLFVALLAFLFGSKSITGFSLGLGGLILVYLGFKVFWRRLERKYEE
ncbi:MAG: hypothetical protein MI976_15225 [Pseudomonadales bacterium]|nr:hypothetical protein [Pseudomonadales bacterium]